MVCNTLERAISYAKIGAFGRDNDAPASTSPGFSQFALNGTLGCLAQMWLFVGRVIKEGCHICGRATQAMALLDLGTVLGLRRCPAYLLDKLAENSEGCFMRSGRGAEIGWAESRPRLASQHGRGRAELTTTPLPWAPGQREMKEIQRDFRLWEENTRGSLLFVLS